MSLEMEYEEKKRKMKEQHEYNKKVIKFYFFF